MQGQRAEEAGHIDDAPGQRATQQRQEGLGHLDHGEQVGVEGALPYLQALLRRGALQVIEHDAGVVDQDVQMAMTLLHRAHGGSNADVVVDIELDGLHRQAFGLQLEGRGHGVVALAPGQQRVHAGLCELTNGLQTDTAGGAGDQCDLGIAHV
ncbi:hypothetical protein AO826_16865 [Xanthomonas phaseoli pv. manihotis]|nr:hypothetical protein AO826_16865 [Xanthomonas phaseoli pv. manihotis]